MFLKIDIKSPLRRTSQTGNLAGSLRNCPKPKFKVSQTQRKKEVRYRHEIGEALSSLLVNIKENLRKTFYLNKTAIQKRERELK